MHQKREKKVMKEHIKNDEEKKGGAKWGPNSQLFSNIG